MLHAAILAGGGGTRLWPLSLPHYPKQFCALASERTLLQETHDRLIGCIAPEAIAILTLPVYRDLVWRQLPDLPDGSLLIEPDGCGTSGALGIAAALSIQRDPDAVIVSLAADLYFGEPERLRQALLLGEQWALRGEIVSISVAPGWPETGYGYLETSETLESSPHGHTVWRATKYVEKPSLQDAAAMVEAGGYLWHTGIFVCRADLLLSALEAYSTDLGHAVIDGAQRVAANGSEALMGENWSGIDDGMPIEKTVLEHAPSVVALETPGAWSDLGSWTQIARLREPDGDGNAFWTTTSSAPSSMSAHATFVRSTMNRPIALVGVEDLIVVDSEDGLLICHKNHAQRVRDVSEALRMERRPEAR